MGAADLSEEDRRKIRELLSRPMVLPEEFRSWLPDWLAQNIPPLPISHFSGYESRRGQFDEEIDDAGTVYSSLTGNWNDQVTPNPFIDKLSNGAYLVIWGCFFEGGAGASTGDIGISINGANPDADLAASGTNLLDDGLYVSRAHIFEGVTNASGVNTLAAVCRLTDLSGGATIRVGSRYMITLKAA